MKNLLIINLIVILFSSVGFPQDCTEEQEKTVFTGEPLTLDAYVDWPLPLSYTWYKDGEEMPQDTGATLTFSSAQLLQNGYYTCVRRCSTWTSPEIICFDIFVNQEEGSSTRKQYPENQLVIWYEEYATEGEKQAIRDTLIDKGAKLERSCLCDIELWDNVPSNIVVGDGVISTVQDTLDEDEGGPNYLIEIPQPYYCISNWQLRPGHLPNIGGNPYPVEVAILDTGFDPSHSTIAPFLWQNELSPDACCTASDPFGYNAVNYCSTVSDKQGHGTAVAGLVADYVPSDLNMEMMNIKVMDKHGGSLFDLICGGNFALENGAKIINMSFGYYGGKSNLLERFVKKAKADNALLVTSAGNEGCGQNDHWPASFARYSQYNHIIRVGAVDGEKNLMEYSSKADIYAVGHNLICPAPNGAEALKSGTSFANAFVTARAAAIRSEDNELSPNDLIGRLLSDEYSTLNSKNDLRILNVDLIPEDQGEPLYFPQDTLITVPIFEVENIDVRGKITAWSTIDTTSVTNFRAGEEIRLTPGFNAKRGSFFSASIENCDEDTSPLGRQDRATQVLDNEEDILGIDLTTAENNSNFIIHPNPFFNRTTLQFGLESSAKVHLSIYNAIGQQVTVLAQGSKEKGVHSYTFTAGELAAGLYYAVLRKDGEVLTKKLVISR